MPQPWEQDAIVSGPAAPAPQAPARPSGPVYGAPRQAPVVTPLQVRADARAEDAAARAARGEVRAEQAATRAAAGSPGEGYRIGANGVAEIIPGGKADTATAQARSAEGLLRAAGVDLARGIDPVADLIKGSTSGGLEKLGAETYGYVTGESTSGMENIGALQTIASELTLQMTGGSLGAQVSNSDRDFIVQRIGNIADPSVPADQRLAAWQQVKARMANITGQAIPETAPATDGQAAPEGQVLLGYGRNEDGTEFPLYGYPPQGADGGPDGSGGNPPPGGGGSPYSMDSIALGLKQGVGDIVEGAAALPGMVINPIGQALYDVLGYDRKYDTGTILREAVGLPDNPNQATSTINQFATSALTGAGLARGLTTLASPGVARNVMETLGRTPIRDTLAGAGAGAGMVAGERSGIPGGALAGAVAGGLAGYGAGNVAMRAGTASQPNALAMAASRQGVDMLPADAGGPVARAVTTGTKASPISVAPVVNAAERQQAQMGQATRRAAESQGAVADTDIVGQGVRSAAERYTRRTSERGARLYERAGEAAHGVRIKPLQTMARLDQEIARVRNDPSAPASAVDDLVRFRQNIEGGVSVAGLRDARTRLSQGVYDGKLRSGSETAMWRGILADLSTDIEGGLVQAGKSDAAAMFRRADAFWKGRVEHIDEVLQPILGKNRSGEDIVSSIESMARGRSGGNARLGRLLAEMTPEEAGTVRATVIDRLGRANPGAQNAEGTAYSASTFLTNWNKMTPQAKASLFSDPQLRGNLNDLATLAEGMKQGQSMANFSNTAVGIGSNIGIQGAVAISNPVAALFGAGAQYLTGKLMASPGFARLLARTSKMKPEQAARSLPEQLGVLAAKEPIIANDIASVQQFLSQAFSQSPGRLAASENEGNRGPEIP